MWVANEGRLKAREESYSGPAKDGSKSFQATRNEAKRQRGKTRGGIRGLIQDILQ